MPDRCSSPRHAPDKAAGGDSATPGFAPRSRAAFDPCNRPREYGGRKGPEPTRYGDWEKNGRCIDF